MQKITKTSGVSKPRLTTNSLVKISVLSVLSYILMVIDFPLPMFPSFLKLDFSDIPALLGSFAIGPMMMMTAVGVIVNLYITLPFYSAFMPMDAIVNLGTVVNSRIVDVKTLVLYGISPFNILKGAVIAFVTLLIYKKISPILKNN